MIGQKKLLEKFNSIDDISKSTILLGPSGSGKKTLINEVADNLNIEIIKIDSILSNELKEKIYTYPNLCIILFDLNKKLQTKQLITIQNSILKLLEEPPVNARIFVLAENESYLLNTILNRCDIINMDFYSNDELRQIALDNEVHTLNGYTDETFKYISTPQEVINLPDVNQILHLEELVSTILSSIQRANVSNILSITRKINFGDNDKLFDLNLFLKVFEYKLVDLIKNEYDKKYLDVFILFNKFNFNINKFNVNKINLFEGFLLDLKTIL